MIWIETSVAYWQYTYVHTAHGSQTHHTRQTKKMVTITRMMTITAPPTAPAIIAIITLSPCSVSREREWERLASSNLKCHTNIAKAVEHTCWCCWRWPFPLHLLSVHNHHGSYLKLSPSLHHPPTGPARKQNTPPRVVNLVVDYVLGGEALPRDIHGSWVEGSNNHPLHLTCSDHW